MQILLFDSCLKTQIEYLAKTTLKMLLPLTQAPTNIGFQLLNFFKKPSTSFRTEPKQIQFAINPNNLTAQEAGIASLKEL